MSATSSGAFEHFISEGEKSSITYLVMKQCVNNYLDTTCNINAHFWAEYVTLHVNTRQSRR